MIFFYIYYFIIKSLEPRKFIKFNNTLLFITLKINYYNTVLSFILFPFPYKLPMYCNLICITDPKFYK
jgi:hypothetical protein